MTRKEFGLKLKELRINAGLTQADVADNLGFDEKNGKGRVSDWERGKGQPDADTFLVLCDLYGVRDVLAEFKPELKSGIAEKPLQGDESEIISLYRSAEPKIKEAVKSVLLSCVPGREAYEKMVDGYERTRNPRNSGSA